MGREIKKNKHIIYFDWLRLIAAFAVVLVHVCHSFANDGSVNSMYAFEIESFTKWAVPIFFMISGSLFLNKKVSIKQMWLKYILRLVVLFAFWSAVHALSFNQESKDIVTICRNIIAGPTHFWFFFVLIGLYAINPILQLVVSKKNICTYFLIITAIFSFVIPNIVAVLSTFDIDIYKDINAYISKFKLQIGSAYVFFYVLGYYIFKHDIKKIARRCLYILAILSFISLASITNALFFTQYDHLITLMFEYNTVFCALEAAAIFTFFKHNCNKVPPKAQNILAELSRATLGVYIVHRLFITYTILYVYNFSNSAAYLAIIIAIIIYALSMLTSLAIRRIPIAKDWLI